MFTYSGGKGSYIVWDETDGNVKSYGTMAKNGNVWEIKPHGSNDVVAVGKTRDFALSNLTVTTIVAESQDEPKPDVVITGEMAAEALKDAVAERGADFVYRNHNSGTYLAVRNDGVTQGYAPIGYKSFFCKYVWDGAPSCGVGLALSKLGVPLHELEKMDVISDPAIGSGIGDVTAPEGFTLTDDARLVFEEFQYNQDRGKTWGVALDRALHML